MAARRPPERNGSTALATRSPKRGKEVKCLADLGFAHLDTEEPHESQLPGIMEALGQLQLDFENSGDFREAELVRVRLDKLRIQEEARQHEEFQSRQIAERLGVEEAHMQELQEFNEVWDSKDAEFDSHVILLQETLAERHMQSAGAYRDKIEKETEPRIPKWSKELLNLQRTRDTLGKQKNYVEAAKVKEDTDKLERKEHGAWKTARDTKLARLEEQFLTKQHMEMSGLIARIEANRSEHKLAKKRELQRLLQRYHNVKSQMESQQKIKYQRANKYQEVDLETASQVSSRPGPHSGSRSSFIGGPRRTLDGKVSSFSTGSPGGGQRTSNAGADLGPRPSTGAERRSSGAPVMASKEAGPEPNSTAMAFAPPARSSTSGVAGRGSVKAVEARRSSNNSNSLPIWK